MRAVRQCLSLTLTILCFGVIGAAWFEAAFAEGSTTSSYRIIATYRVDFGGFTVSFARGRETGSDWVEVGVRSRAGYYLK